MQQTLIIAGMHRSGTSLITSWLNRCGLHVGERLEAANIGNQLGHFEDMEFLKMHQEILKNNNLPISGMVDVQDIPVSVYQLEKIKGIIHAKDRLYEQWGWKDPRTCLFLDTYSQLLPDARYLVILRDHRSVLNSLLKREFAFANKKYMSRGYFARWIWVNIRRNHWEAKFYRQNADKFLRVWITYSEEILKTLKKLSPKNYLVVDYNVLLKKDKGVFAHLTGNWNFDLNYADFNEIYNQKLMSDADDDVDVFVSDKMLLIRANYLQIRLNRYMKFTTGDEVLMVN